MTRATGKRRPHFTNRLPADPAVRRWSEWSAANRTFYQHFLAWLAETHFSPSARNLYGVAARQALGFLDRPYWTIDPDADLERAWAHLQQRPLAPSTLADYHKGLRKLGEYLRLRLHRPPRPKAIHWDHYLAGLPAGLAEAIRHYFAFRARAWPVERRHERTQDSLSHLTLFLRWLAARDRLHALADLTPQPWHDYLDERLAQGRDADTVNGELSELQQFLYYLRDEHNQPVCERLFLLKGLARGRRLPKDVPVERLRRLCAEIQAEAVAGHAGKRRGGQMDLAWFLLMLHSGLRTGEVRRMRLADVDFAGRKVRIEQSKGLKDRLVCLSAAGIAALQAYLGVRGPAEALPEPVFIYAHKALSESYCSQRLVTYGQRCGVRVTPHQLRHSCATLLLNAGAPVLTVQALLGHKWVDTTLGYARLYDGTVAADYYGAMQVIEQRLALPEDRLHPAPRLGELVSLVDRLQAGTLTPAQAETVRALRSGLLLLAEPEATLAKAPEPVG